MNSIENSRLKAYPQSAFLNRFIELLLENDEAYCVLRNHTGLPNSLNGSDLDIAVNYGRGEGVVGIAKQAAEECGGFPIISYTGSIYVVRFLGNIDGVNWGVALDIFEDISYKGISYLKTEKLISKAFDYNGVRVADINDSLCLALLKELLSNGRDRKGYLAAVIIIAQEYDDAFDFLKDDIATILVELCSKKNRSKSEVLEHASKLRKRVLWSKGLGGIHHRFNNFVSRAKRVFKPAGFSVAVLGTDGSGKTTLIHGITPLIESATHNSVDYEHLRPNWLPPLSAAKSGGDSVSKEVNTDPHGGKESNFISSLIRLTYYSIDYSIGYWIKIYPKLIVRPKVCVFDRYYYDFIFDPKRMRISLPQWILKSAFFFAPKPSLVLCLVGDPQLIYERKPETNVLAVADHVAYLEKLSFKTNIFRIDTTTSYQESMESCLGAFENKR